jgi:hypothetical protein
MGLYKGVAYKYPVFMGYEHLLLCEDDTAYSICGTGHAFAVELADIFVSVGAVYTTAVTVDAEVEGRPVLDYGLVKRRQQDIRFIVKLGNGYYQ